MNDQKKNIVAGPPDQQCEMVGRGPSSRFCNTPSGGKKKAVMITLILLLSGVLVGSGVYFFFVANKDVCAQIFPNGTAGENLIGNGICLMAKYPNCTATYFGNMGSGRCDGWQYNTEECGWDGGDCVELNTKYPNCHAANPSNIGDGYCEIVEDRTLKHADGTDGIA